jgi:hypothetical protein
MFRAILCSSSGGQNYIFTASGIVTLCERHCSAPVESGLRSRILCEFKKLILEHSQYLCGAYLFLETFYIRKAKNMCISRKVQKGKKFDENFTN